MSYRFADSLRADICHTGLLTACELLANLYDIYHRCVYSEKTPNDGQRKCPKHVEFYSKNKFEILVNLVGFIIRSSIKLILKLLRDVAVFLHHPQGAYTGC